MSEAGVGHASEAEGREFAAGLRTLLGWLQAADVGGNEVAVLVREVLGAAGDEHSVVTRQLPPFEHVNLQTALDSWSAAGDRQVQVRGIALPPHYGGISLQQLVSGDALPPLRLCAPNV